MNTRVSHTVQILFFPLFPVTIFKVITFNNANLMRVHHMPKLIQVIVGQLPKIIWIAYCRKYIVGLSSLIAIIGFNLQELR